MMPSMARVSLGMTSATHPAELGPCARPRFTAEQVGEALTAAGHQLVDRAAAEVQVVELDTHDGVGGGAPLVLTSLGRPIDPWHAIADAGERQPFIDPWVADLEKRKRAALPYRADAYADSFADLLAAVEVALRGKSADAPALRYRGGLFNSVSVRPGTDFALGVEPRPQVLGRGVGADVSMPTPQLARAHLQVSVNEGDGLEVTDLGSTNGTWLCQPDGEIVALRPGNAVLARPGALVMPDASFRFIVV
jgi:hypothetical protein